MSSWSVTRLQVGAKKKMCMVLGRLRYRSCSLDSRFLGDVRDSRILLYFGCGLSLDKLPTQPKSTFLANPGVSEFPANLGMDTSFQRTLPILGRTLAER